MPKSKTKTAKAKENARDRFRDCHCLKVPSFPRGTKNKQQLNRSLSLSPARPEFILPLTSKPHRADNIRNIFDLTKEDSPYNNYAKSNVKHPCYPSRAMSAESMMVDPQPENEDRYINIKNTETNKRLMFDSPRSRSATSPPAKSLVKKVTAAATRTSPVSSDDDDDDEWAAALQEEHKELETVPSGLTASGEKMKSYLDEMRKKRKAPLVAAAKGKGKGKKSGTANGPALANLNTELHDALPSAVTVTLERLSRFHGSDLFFHEKKVNEMKQMLPDMYAELLIGKMTEYLAQKESGSDCELPTFIRRCAGPPMILTLSPR